VSHRVIIGGSQTLLEKHSIFTELISLSSDLFANEKRWFNIP